MYFGRIRGRYYHEVRLPFDSPGWHRNFPLDASEPEPVDLERISLVDAMTFMLWGAGRRDRGAIFLDNIRIE